MHKPLTLNQRPPPWGLRKNIMKYIPEHEADDVDAEFIHQTMLKLGADEADDVDAEFIHQTMLKFNAE